MNIYIILQIIINTNYITILHNVSLLPQNFKGKTPKLYFTIFMLNNIDPKITKYEESMVEKNGVYKSICSSINFNWNLPII